MKKDFLAAAFISLAFLTAGFVLVHFKWIGYGLSFFVFLPFVLGYTFGKSTVKTASLWGLIASFVVFFILLLIGGLEGMGCILMALPLVIAAVAIGVWLKRTSGRKSDDNILDSSILPFGLFLLFAFAEFRFFGNQPVLNEVTTEFEYPYTPMQVYDAIKSVDTMDTDKPFLMHLDLPVPEKCVLDTEAVGGIRTCYFDCGYIQQRITGMERGKSLDLEVTDFHLTGREWLGFRDASYTFRETTPGHCKLTRITRYTSELYPRWYWRLFEQASVEQEHDYVFRNLVKDLNNKYGRQ